MSARYVNKRTAVFWRGFNYQANDPVAVVGGRSNAGTPTVQPLLIDSATGALVVNATITPSGTQNINLLQVGSNSVVNAGVNGLLAVGGAAADGAAVSGNPVRIGGKDGSGNTQDILTDTSGQQIIVGAAADDAAAVGNPVRVAGVYSSSLPTLTDGDVADILLDSSSRPLIAWGQRLDPANDAVYAGLLTDKIGVTGNPNTALTPVFVAVAAASNGDNTLVAADATRKIRVLAGHLTMTGTAVTIRFESGAGGTALTGQMTPLQGTSIDLPFCPLGHFETAVNTLLNLELGGAQAVAGWLVYVLVP